MKLELDLNSSQNSTLINHSENEGSEDVKKMLRSGISFAKEGNRVEARQMLLGVTEVEPNNETAWLWLASISEYPEELLVFLQNVLKVNPENERALEWAKQTKSLLSKTFVQRGINAAQNNQKEFAKQCFLQGIVHDGENEMAWLWLASSSDSQEEKVSHLQKVLRINPDNETALSSLSSVKGQMSQGLLKKANSAAISGDHETARQTLNTIMKNSPNIEEAWILKAFLASDFYEKIECYEKALEINSECEAAQAGLASLKLLMPKVPKAVVEVSQPVAKEEEIFVEATVVQEEVSIVQEEVEFNENFDLEQLAEELPVEIVEFEAEQPQPESRAFAEEVLLERQEEETSIHETQTGFKEEFGENPSQQIRVESIFNYDEVISQEEAFAEESQAESVLEFDESSNNPTQELDEDYAQHAAASFNDSAEENVAEFQAADEVAETVLEAEAENAADLEDFYTEKSVESQNETIEESVPVQPKAEVRITEVYDREVTPAVYGSEFFANDGFVLVPQNDPFADYSQETVEFSYSEVEEVGEAQQAGQAEQVAEAEEVEEIEQVAEVQQVEEVEEVIEAATSEEFEEVAQVVETQEVEQVVEALADEQVEEVQQFVESQQTVETEEVEEVIEASQAEEVEEIEQTAVAEDFAEVVETQSAEQIEEAQQVEEVAEAQQFEQVEEVVEAQQFEQVEEVVEAQAVEEAEEVEQFAEAEEAEQTEQFEQFAEVEEESVEVAEVEAQTPDEPQVQLNLCPFCAAENESQAVVCNSCRAMLSLADLEELISHQGVNQDLLLQAIEKMEVEKGLRDFDAEELTFLAIAHLNAKNLEKGFNYLQEAAKLNPNDAILPSKIKFLTAHLEELRANKTGTIGKNRTILVVDDSPTVRKLISGKLEKCGHSVLSAIDGMDALAKINEVIPDLILLDITMPRLDGYQVCKLIRNNEMTKDVPIVMISGKDGFFDKVRGRMAGSSGYITKPFGPDTLMKTIETYLG